MQVAPGTHLGPYEIVAPIGAGGMGEVFKARDTRLERSVAIKVLPAELAKDAQFKLRFEREAKAISALNHPNICTLYDVGHENGTDFLVMELVEGESLADRLAKGPLPLDQVLRYGAQIADALDRAHRSGVIHRDLKPGNIMITKSGTKLLDFGLAKSGAAGVLGRQPAAKTAATAHDATEHKPLTREGTIIGTFQYMAPEQLEGEEADARTDIFSFGAVLYEMATGKRAFDGKTRTSLIAAIVSGEPRPMREWQPLTPPSFERLVRICLAKDPERRWNSAHDVRLELEAIASGAGEQPVSPVRRPAWWSIAAYAAVLFAGIGIGFLLFSLFSRQERRTLAGVRQPLHLGNNTALANYASRLGVAISRDGKILAYVASNGPSLPAQLFIRRMDQFDSVPVQGSNGAYDPFFSPDGASVAFFAGNRLKRVSVEGGIPIDLDTGVITGRGGSWAADGMIYYTRRHSAGIWKVPAAGGTPAAVTVPDSAHGENSHRWPQVLPDGKNILFTIRTSNISTFDEASIAVVSLRTGKWKTVIQGGTFGRYLPTGHLLFARGGALWAVRFDLKRMAAGGVPARVLDDVLVARSSGVAQFAVSETGTLAFLTGKDEGGSTLIWVDEEGHDQPVSDISRTFLRPRLSPDGRRIAVGVQQANDDIYVYDTDRATLGRFSFEAGDEIQPLWTRDGTRLIFTSLRNENSRLMRKRTDGAGDAEELAAFSQRIYGVSWTKDGQLVVAVDNPATGWDLATFDTHAPAALRPLVQSSFADFAGKVSPDGRWLAYESNESGVPQIYVQDMSGDHQRSQISIDGGAAAHWSRDGRKLYFARGNRLFAVDVTDPRSFKTTKPRVLFEKPFFECEDYDVAPDGKHFLMCKSSSPERVPRVNVIFDFFSDVKRGQ